MLNSCKMAIYNPDNGNNRRAYSRHIGCLRSIVNLGSFKRVHVVTSHLKTHVIGDELHSCMIIDQPSNYIDAECTGVSLILMA